jgi:hypothetical protein
MFEQTSVIEHFNKFINRVRPLYLIDHAGRAGNGFFQTLFDEHPEVLSIPWIHYCTSYFISEFGDHTCVDSSQAHEFWTSKSYFRFFYYELNESDKDLVYRFGGNPESQIDRIQVREIFDQIVLSQTNISRKEIIYASFYAMAKALGRDLARINQVVLTDAISLRDESFSDGFKGRIIDLILSDDPDAVIIQLIRDPRASFASTNHQFINQLGNMYSLQIGNISSRLKELAEAKFNMSGPFVFGFLILFFVELFKCVERKKKEFPKNFLLLKNEDLNLRFVPTMELLCRNLNITFNTKWNAKGYSPTMLGSEWKGTGGYSNRYQTKHNGPLQNDPDEVSSNVVGPNEYVTKRWEKRLSKKEIYILDYFFRHEIQTYRYKFLTPDPFSKTEASVWLKMLAPLRGEVPPIQWLFSGWQQSPKEFGNRITYYILLPVFFVFARLVFLLSKSTRKILFTRSR